MMDLGDQKHESRGDPDTNWPCVWIEQIEHLIIHPQDSKEAALDHLWCERVDFANTRISKRHDFGGPAMRDDSFTGKDFYTPWKKLAS
jgi:hypothetical protein